MGGLLQRLLLGVWLMLAPLAGAARAEIPDSVLGALGFYRATSAPDPATYALQTDLAWIGLYSGPIDGRDGMMTRAALRGFLDGIGAGDLTAESRALLATRAAQTRQAAQIRPSYFDWIGVSIPLPTAILRGIEVAGSPPLGLTLSGSGAGSLLVNLARGLTPTTPPQWSALRARSIPNAYEDARILRRGANGNYGFLLWTAEDIEVLEVFASQSGEWRSLQLSYYADSGRDMRPLLTEILAGTVLFAGEGVSTATMRSRISSGNYPGADQLPSWYLTMIASGSGSLVSYDGHVLTNHHVVSGCARITVNGHPALLLGADVQQDLALLRVEAFAGRRPVALAAQDAELGMPVYVMGYPLFSTSQSINLTEGIVSANVGLQGNRTHIQITAPVQPGNSGGPVLSPSGAQVAVVVAKASSSFRMEQGAENMAWVIRISVVREFLGRFGVQPVLARGDLSAGLGAPVPVQDWRGFTLRVECHG